jgi:hypothetical protein
MGTRHFEINQTHISLDASMQQSILENNAQAAHLDAGVYRLGPGWPASALLILRALACIYAEDTCSIRV